MGAGGPVAGQSGKPRPQDGPAKDGREARRQGPQLAEPRWAAVFGPGSSRRKLIADARLEWRRILPGLERCGRLTELDHGAVVDYCVCWARVLELEQLLTAEGMQLKTTRGSIKHPALLSLNQYRQRVQRYQSELGLTIMARARLNLEEPEPADDDSDLDDPSNSAEG